MPPISRRRLLGLGATAAGVAALTVAGVETDVLPGRVRIHSALGLNGSPGQAPSGQAQLVTGTFFSKARRTEVAWTIAYPPAMAPGTPMPVLVALHGRFVDRTNVFGEHIGLDHYLADDPSLRFAIAAPDGGDTYGHPRRSGEDAGAMVIDEFLPLLADHGLQTERIGLYGYSMGGYGALRLAGILGPDRVSAVVAVSAALFRSAGETPPGAFDDADDFAAHDIMHRAAELNGIPVRLDCGRGDPFRRAVASYRDGFPTGHEPAGGFQAGGHDDGYWRRMAPAELAFVAQYLS